MFAITTFGIGKPVTVRAIMPEWDLVEGESFKAEVWQPGMVLADNAQSLVIPSAPPELMVSQINRAQLEQQLILEGKDELVLSVINSIGEETKRKLVMARYRSETNFKIDDPDLLMLAPALGYDTPEKIQAFFNNASKF